jgi:hypothetical protein
MDKVTLRRLGRAGFFLLAVGLLVWLLDRIGWQEIGESFARVGWTGAAVLLAIGFLETVFDSTSFYFALSRRVGVLRCLVYNGAGAIVNTLIPWEAGEALKGTLLTRHVSTAEAIRATVLWNYLFKLTRPLVAVAAAITGAIIGADVQPSVLWLIIGACAASLVPYILLKLLLRFGALELGVRALKSLRLLRRDVDAVTRSAHDLDERIRRFKSEAPGDYALVLLFQILARVTSWAAWGIAIHLVGLEVSFALVALLYAAVSVAGYLVMLFPVRIGVTEGVGYLVFQLLGLDGGMGLIISVIMRIKGLLVNGVPGLLAGFRNTSRVR